MPTFKTRFLSKELFQFVSVCCQLTMCILLSKNGYKMVVFMISDSQKILKTFDSFIAFYTLETLLLFSEFNENEIYR